METIKHIKLNRIERANSMVCLQSISNINAVIEMAEQTKKRVFCWENESDFNLIGRYWTAMFPGVRRQHSKVSAEWGELGFQGSDPSTDFRGMGLLGLIQLEYFASTQSTRARNVLSESMHPRRYYPFSATGINITAFVMELLRDNRLHTALIGQLERQCLESRSSQMAPNSLLLLATAPSSYDGACMYADCQSADELLVQACSVMHEVYCEVFVAFNDLWVARDPPNIMAFAGVFAEVKSSFRLKYPAVGAGQHSIADSIARKDMPAAEG